MTCGAYRYCMDIGQRIERLRDEQGWTRAQLAHRAGVTEGQLSRIVNTKFRPRWETLAGLCRAFGLSPAELMEGVEFAPSDYPKHQSVTGTGGK